MRVTPIPCLSDNYAYLIQSDEGPEGVVVDPSSAGPVLDRVEKAGVRLVAILATHHHYDHVGGNEELLATIPGLSVFGHASDRDRVPGLDHPLEDGQKFNVAGLDCLALHVPGHTRGALAYLLDGAVFTGDTLFVAGCGRLFEGTAEQMYLSLNEKLARLDGATKVFVGHEYTRKNLEFALTLEPDRVPVREKAKRVAALRAQGQPTVPSTIDEEKSTNPFLRVTSPGIIASVTGTLGARRDPVSVFAAVRAAKDRF